MAAQFVPAQTFSVDELFGTLLVLHWWEESHTQTIGLCRRTVQKSCVDRRHAELHRFDFGLFAAPQPQIVARAPLDLMSNDANHGQFRRLFKILLETGSDILQTPSTHEEVLNIY